MKKILVTGGCGFIGSNFIRFCLSAYPEVAILNLDALTYAGNLENLADLEKHPRYTFIKGDITDRPTVQRAMDGAEAVVHFAAESHVDRSIQSAEPFVRTNVLGTQVLLDVARAQKSLRWLQISTDEVYGSAPVGRTFQEEDALHPSSPYAASKAAADLLALSYHTTFGLEVVVVRSANNYGPYQFPEKFIPLFLTNALEDKPLPLYGDGLQMRDWLHVTDNCRAIAQVLWAGRSGQIYNIGTGEEKPNLEVAKQLLRALHKPESLIKRVTDRPGHDRRYSIATHKIQQELGWQPLVSFAEGMQQTVAWYLAHESWWKRIKSGEYQTYYARQYLGQV